MLDLTVSKTIRAAFAAIIAGVSWPAINEQTKLDAERPIPLTSASFSKHDCNWVDSHKAESLSGCSKIAILHYSEREAQNDLTAASFCAVEHETDCVLGIEIGLHMPAAFVYSPSDGMRMLMAPTILNHSTDSLEQKNIKVSNPGNAGECDILAFYPEINIEYFAGGTKMLRTEVLRGAPAYCVQLLKSVTSEDCWERIE
jgi:hypothetical protein